MCLPAKQRQTQLKKYFQSTDVFKGHSSKSGTGKFLIGFAHFGCFCCLEPSPPKKKKKKISQEYPTLKRMQNTFQGKKTGKEGCMKQTCIKCTQTHNSSSQIVSDNSPETKNSAEMPAHTQTTNAIHTMTVFYFLENAHFTIPSGISTREKSGCFPWGRSLLWQWHYHSYISSPYYNGDTTHATISSPLQVQQWHNPTFNLINATSTTSEISTELSHGNSFFGGGWGKGAAVAYLTCAHL